MVDRYEDTYQRIYEALSRILRTLVGIKYLRLAVH